MGGSWVARLGLLITLVTRSLKIRMYRGKLLRTFAYKGEEGGGGGSKSMKMMRTYLMDGLLHLFLVCSCVL